MTPKKLQKKIIPGIPLKSEMRLKMAIPPLTSMYVNIVCVCVRLNISTHH